MRGLYSFGYGTVQWDRGCHLSLLQRSTPYLLVQSLRDGLWQKTEIFCFPNENVVLAYDDGNKMTMMQRQKASNACGDGTLAKKTTQSDGSRLGQAPVATKRK